MRGPDGISTIVSFRTTPSGAAESEILLWRFCGGQLRLKKKEKKSALLPSLPIVSLYFREHETFRIDRYATFRRGRVTSEFRSSAQARICKIASVHLDRIDRASSSIFFSVSSSFFARDIDIRYFYYIYSFRERLYSYSIFLSRDGIPPYTYAA